LHIARLRAQGKVVEIRAADLRFTRDETDEFLNGVMQLALDVDLVATLESRTEGWIAGLQLAALSLVGRPVAHLVATLQGNNPFLIQYLLEEVFGRQPLQVQKFLLRTSILERLCGPLCDALLNRSGSQRVLDQLEHANLFLVPLDDQQVWYRYHHLFREFLQTRLRRTELERMGALRRAASEWYAANGFLREAVAHALEMRDWEYAAEVVERHGMPTLMHSEISTVYEWCSAFPADTLRKHPMLCILLSWTLVLGYRRDHQPRIEAYLSAVDDSAARTDDQQQGRWLKGQAAVVRTFTGNVPQLCPDPRAQLDLAQRALDLLPADDALRSTTTLTIGYAMMAQHDAKAATEALEQARRLSLSGNNYYGAVEARFQQALLAQQRGQLQPAAEICRLGKTEISEVIAHPERELPAVGSLDIALGSVLLEQNRLTEAENALTAGLELVAWTINPYYQLTACVALARLRQIQRRPVEARQFLDRVEQLWPDISFCIEGLRIVDSLRSGAYDSAAEAGAITWSRQFTASLGSDLTLPGLGPLGAAEAYYLGFLALSHVHVAVGSPAVALEYLEPALHVADGHDLQQRIIELSLSSALAYTTVGDQRRATEALVRALEVAEALGYVRTFDQGPALRQLLVDGARRGIAREYIWHILEAIRRPDTASGISELPMLSPSSHVESLTARELEVLHLLENGLLNRQIAERLFISVGTVKRHTANIYGKLGVETRTQAIVRARELGETRS
jgi:LuxR family maltose regulon positive regulatory protein